MSSDSDPLDQAFPSSDQPQAFSGDPLDAAFAEKEKEKTAPPGAAKLFLHQTQDMASGAANFVGTGLDLARNAYRLSTGQDPIEYNGPESLGKSFASLFQHDPDVQAPSQDPKEAIRQSLTKVQDTDTGKRAINSPLGQTLLKDVLPPASVVAPWIGKGVGLMGDAMAGGEDAAAVAGGAQKVVDNAYSSQSMGAASAAPQLSANSPSLRQAILDSSRRTGGAVNRDALDAHVNADRNGVQLMKGQATRDPVQYSAEQNSTDPRIAGRIKEQNDQLTDRLDEIRRDAAPTSVHNDAIQNGQTVVDSLKAYDEPIKADIQAKYKALTDANGGTVPIDPGQFLTNVDAALKKGFLTRTAANSSEVSEILDHVRSGEPIDFEAFENARTRLAEAQRAGGSPAAAAKIVRNELEQMPLSPDAQKLKGLADTARSAAKARFDALDRDPAYQAAVDDTVKRNEASPLADRFLDKYALGTAPKVNLDNMLSKLDDEAKGAVASHALNQVRTSAIGKTGQVLPSGYNAALQKLQPKIESLLQPSTIDDLQSLGKTINDAKVPPPGNHVNFSKSGVISNAANAAQGAAEHIANIKTSGLYGLGKKILTSDKAANDKFVNEALKPGAGLDDLR